MQNILCLRMNSIFLLMLYGFFFNFNAFGSDIFSHADVIMSSIAKKVLKVHENALNNGNESFRKQDTSTTNPHFLSRKRSRVEKDSSSLYKNPPSSTKKFRKTENDISLREHLDQTNEAFLVLPDEILIHIVFYLKGTDFIRFKMTNVKFYTLCQDPNLTLTFDDQDQLLSIIEKDPQDFRQRAYRTNPQIIAPTLIKLAQTKEYFPHDHFDTPNERLKSLLAWKRFLQIVCLANDLGAEEAQEILDSESNMKIYFADNYIYWVDSIPSKEEEMAIQTCCIQQAACLSKEAREALIKSYKTGSGFTVQNDEKASYWENFSLQHYLWEED